MLYAFSFHSVGLIVATPRNCKMWVNSVASIEDVFDEDVDDISLSNKEWKYNMEKRGKDGFRDGIDAGKGAALQVGFNMGYREGATKMRAVGQLKGILSAVQCLCQAQMPGSPALASVASLLQRVETHEDRLMEAMRKAQERPEKCESVTQMVDDMEDLNVEQRDQGEESGCCNKDGDCCGKAGEVDCCVLVSQSSFSIEESLEQLLRCCLDLVTQLGLPEELKCHIQQIINT